MKLKMSHPKVKSFITQLEEGTVLSIHGGLNAGINTGGGWDPTILVEQEVKNPTTMVTGCNNNCNQTIKYSMLLECLIY